MTKLTIRDLPQLRKLDQAARAAVLGGMGYLDAEPLILTHPDASFVPVRVQWLLRNLPPFIYHPPVFPGPAIPNGAPTVGV
ncbi:hypothetical protein [Cupriavidus necator]|uniref:hypothetical protein n=1 Tax=Cupriavidus necator TaxID=106590 RepID=UPI0005B3C5E2|nr:hypothetical protein [Cupriavidus necator]